MGTVGATMALMSIDDAAKLHKRKRQVIDSILTLLRGDTPAADPLVSTRLSVDESSRIEQSWPSSPTTPSLKSGPFCSSKHINCFGCGNKLVPASSWYFAGDGVFCSYSCRKPNLSHLLAQQPFSRPQDHRSPASLTPPQHSLAVHQGPPRSLSFSRSKSMSQLPPDPS